MNLTHENRDTIKEVWDWITEKYEKFTNFLSNPGKVLFGSNAVNAPALSAMSGTATSGQDSRMTGDISVRIIADSGVKADVESVNATGGTLSAEPVSYLMSGD